MKSAYRIAVPLLMVSALAACDRSETDVTQAPGAPLPAAEPLATEATTPPTPPFASSNVATATQAPADPNKGPRASSGEVASASSPEYTQAMEQLQAAAQRLREATQAMAKEPAGERRNQAIRETNQALHETNEAMMRLPPELRSEAGAALATTGSAGASGTSASSASAGAPGTTPPSLASSTANAGGAGTTRSDGAIGIAGSPGVFGTTTMPAGSGVSGSGAPQSGADYTRAMDSLLKAAQQLRVSLQAMAQQPANTKRDQAMKQARQALYETQQAMIQLPGAPNTAAK